MIVDIVLLFAGLAVIYLGAQWFVNSAASLAESWGVSPFLVGVVIVGFGTSAPELALGILSSMEGASSISLGNVIGSNVNNLTYILFVNLLFASLLVTWKEVRLEGTFVIVAVSSAIILALDGSFSFWDGLMFIIIFSSFIWLLFFRPRPLHQGEPKPLPRQGRNVRYLLLIIGLVLLVGGSQLVVSGAIGIATDLGVSEFLIGVTIVSLGTTLPELASGIIASRNKRFELALGNALGTVIFQTLFIIGVGSMIATIAVPWNDILYGLLPMLLLALLLLGIITVKRRLTRREGVILLAGYVLFTLLIVQTG